MRCDYMKCNKSYATPFVINLQVYYETRCITFYYISCKITTHFKILITFCMFITKCVVTTL